MKHLVFLFSLTFLIFFSCIEQTTENVTETNFNYHLAKEGTLYSSFHIVDTIVVEGDDLPPRPEGYVCGVKDVEVWVFDHYEPVAGKTVGIWPEPGGNLEQYLDKWGFTGMVVNNSAGYDNAVAIGYPANKIFFKLSYNSTMNEIFNSIENSNSSLYYIDEPLDKNRFTMDQLIDIADHITTYHPNSLLILGSYSLPSGWYAFPIYTFGQAYNVVLASNSNVRMMCDKYNGDQRYHWEQFRAYYGSNRIFGHYIHSRRDHGDYEELIEKANSLNLINLWYFHGSDGWPNKTSEYCYDSWSNGWLTLWEHKQIHEYRCYYENPCDCDPDLPDGWYLYRVWDFPNDLRIDEGGYHQMNQSNL